MGFLDWRWLKWIRGETRPGGGLSPEQEQAVLAGAYIPEHLAGLMTLISQGRPFLIDEYLGFVKDNWLTFVGYPLERPFTPERCEEVVRRAVETYRPEVLWFIGPEVPPSLGESCTRRQTDDYFRLDLAGGEVKPALGRAAEKVAARLAVERSRAFTRHHQALVAEFMERQELPALVAELYRVMPRYVGGSATACLLNAWDSQGRLSAFYVVERAAPAFDTYVLGCYSKKYYTPHASDLLFWEMVKLARESGKPALQLGLGVNAGIRRFKEKWGGVPFLKYEFCECVYGRSQALFTLELLLEGKR